MMFAKIMKMFNANEVLSEFKNCILKYDFSFFFIERKSKISLEI